MSGAASKRKGSQFEREIARQFGGKRTPLSGAAGGNDITFADGIWNDWGMELKRVAKLPASLVGKDGALTQAEGALPLGSPKKPCALMREDGGRSLFICYAEDMRQWCEALAESGQRMKLRSFARELRAIAQGLETIQ